jgi:serine/threonine protein kinase
MFPLGPHDPKKIGDFVILNRLGAGGMGVVYLARRGNRRVALKVLNQALITDPEARHRLLRESETLGRVSSPFVAKLIDWSVNEDEAWLALSFINGPNLREVISQSGPMSGDRWWALAAGLAEAIEAFHSEDVVHRDVKPSNIIVAPHGPVIIDFGISTVLDATRLTKTGTVEGSPAWLSPEQLEVEQVGLESDVFSLGSTLFYAATGQSPWGAEERLTVPVIFSRILENKPKLELLEPSQREFLEALFRSNPADRPTARELVSRLGKCDSSLFSDGEWLDSLEIGFEEDDEDLTETIADQEEESHTQEVIVEEEEGDAQDTIVQDEKGEGSEEDILSEDGDSADEGTGKTREMERGLIEHDDEDTEELPKPDQDETEGSKEKRKQKTHDDDTKVAVSPRSRAPLMVAAAGAALALVAPTWFAVSALGGSNEGSALGGDQDQTLALEWLEGDLYGQPAATVAETFGNLYSEFDGGVERGACVDRDTARIYQAEPSSPTFSLGRGFESGAPLPVFEVQRGRDSWAVVGETRIESAGFAACDPEFDRLVRSSVTRETLLANQGSEPCVVMRYREPATEAWLEREERWCVWLEGDPPPDAIVIR